MPSTMKRFSEPDAAVNHDAAACGFLLGAGRGIEERREIAAFRDALNQIAG